MSRRTQLEIALIAASTLAMLWLYRSYLERSLILQEQALMDVEDERRRERKASVLVDVQALREFVANGTAGMPPVPAEPPAGDP